MRDTLVSGLPLLGLALTEEQIARLTAFGEAVLEKNAVMNLTAITEPKAVARLHLLDSLTIASAFDLKGKRVIDIGCGAGFPGVPLAIASPEAEITLLDSLKKRMDWLGEVLPHLGVKASLLVARAEEALRDRREKYDLAVARAVARLNILLELCAPYVRPGGRVVAMKGERADEELAECQGAIRTLGLEFCEIRTFPIDGTSHNLVIFKKIAHTPLEYPRTYSRIKARPL